MVSTLVPPPGPGINTYVTRAEADTYLGDSFGQSALWAALTNDQKDQALLTAFKLLERQTWQGEATGEADWPRTGVTDCEGEAVDSSTVPEDIESAQIELAFAISQNPALVTSTTTADNTKRLKAGSAEIEFFNTDGSDNFLPGRFPPNVQELIKCFLQAAGGAATNAESFGTECPKDLSPCRYDLNKPL